MSCCACYDEGLRPPGGITRRTALAVSGRRHVACRGAGRPAGNRRGSAARLALRALPVGADTSIDGFIDSWALPMKGYQHADGYLQEGYPVETLAASKPRWKAETFSRECYLIGHYIESAIGHHDATGRTSMLDSAVRAADDMADALLGSDKPDISGHPEVEQANASEPNVLAPGDTYGEGSAAYVSFLWAHSLFRLTGEVRYTDVAVRIVYNGFAAALALSDENGWAVFERTWRAGETLELDFPMPVTCVSMPASVKGNEGVGAASAARSSIASNSIGCAPRSVLWS